MEFLHKTKKRPLLPFCTLFAHNISSSIIDAFMKLLKASCSPPRTEFVPSS